MEFRVPNLQNVSLKGMRGLVYSPVYELRPNVIDRIISAFGEELSPGKETEIVIQTDLPANANILSIQAVLHVMDSASDPAPEQSSVGIKKNDEAANTYQIETTPPSRPRNVQLRLAGGDVIWTYGGVLSEDSYQLPDFAVQANAYLDQAKAENGKFPLHFLIKSDTAGRARLEIGAGTLKYHQIQTQHWVNDLDQTVRLDRNLNLEFASIEEIPLDRIADAKGSSLLKITMDVGGELGSERLFGQPGFPGNDYTEISGVFSIGQQIKLTTSIHCVGLSLFLIPDSAEIYAEIQSDDDGFPASAAPLAKGNLTLNPDPKSSSGRWNYLPVSPPVELEKDVPYWIVVKGIRGKTYLALTRRPEDSRGYLLVNRGGSFWRVLAPNFRAAAIMSPVYLPGPDNQTSAVEIQLEGTSVVQSIDIGKDPKNISLITEGTPVSNPVVVIIRSHARGTLAIANMITEYGTP